jgi:hypothetical protein
MVSLAGRLGQTVRIHQSSKTKLLISLLPQDGTSVAGKENRNRTSNKVSEAEHLKQQSLRQVHSRQLVIAFGPLLEARR